MRKMTMTELVDAILKEDDIGKKKYLNSLLADELCTNRSDKENMVEALNEPLRHNKSLKKQYKTRYNYISK